MNIETGLFTISTPESIVGVRVDRIASFRYDVKQKHLTLRYLGESAPDVFEGTMAETLIRELQYAGRK